MSVDQILLFPPNRPCKRLRIGQGPSRNGGGPFIAGFSFGALPSQLYQALRITPLLAWLRVTPENSPSNVAAADQPLPPHFRARVVSAASEACAAASTTKDAPGSA